MPGILQAQGYGDDIATDTPWVLGLGAAWWKLQPAALRDHFSQPGHVEVPFLAQPPKHYLGAAWYQRDLDIPAGWSAQRVDLFLERAHWETTVWVDDKRIGSCNSLVAPHEYDLGVLAPGRHRLTVRVDNRQIVRDPKNDGHEVDAHAVTDGLGAAWNGIVGRLELRATEQVWIEDAQVFPNVAKKSVLVRVKIGNIANENGRGRLIATRISVGRKLRAPDRLVGKPPAAESKSKSRSAKTDKSRGTSFIPCSSTLPSASVTASVNTIARRSPSASARSPRTTRTSSSTAAS